MKLNITDAAKAVGKPRSTLYRHMNNGKVSSEDDGEGNKVIDVSELQRVYGEVNTGATSSVASQSVAMHQSATPQNAAKIQLLEQKIEFLERERDTEKERRKMAEDEKAKLLEIVEKQTIMLAAPKDEPEIQQKGFLGRLFGS